MISNAEMEMMEMAVAAGGGWRRVRGGGGGGWIKDMREASSEFDSVIAQTSETVTRGVSFLPQRRLPRAGAVFFFSISLSLSLHQSLSHQLKIQLYTVYMDPTGLHSLRYTKFTC